MSKQLVVGLVGNPNSGKSSLFNQLTGLRQKVGNFPGVTVEKKVGTASLPNGKKYTIVDLPGTYSLHPTTEDERQVLNILANPNSHFFPNLIVYVADILHLEKHLLLFTQLQDLGLPTVLALTMSDIAEKEGVSIKKEVLEKAFTTKVVLVSNRTGNGFDELAKAIEQTAESPVNSNKPFYKLTNQEKALAQKVQDKFQLKNAYQALLWLHHAERLPFLEEVDKQFIKEINSTENFQSLKSRIDETMLRFDDFSPIAEKAIKKTQNGKVSLTDRVDKIVMHRIFGPAIFFLLMLFLFQAIFAWSSGPMDWIEGIMGDLGSFVKANLPDAWYTSLLTDGIIAGLGGVLVFTPQIAILFFLISILEEVGYMARAVVMFDRVMQRFGLNGRSIVALISGNACAIPAVMSTRTISNWKERLITIMVTPLMACSARIPVYIVLVAFIVPSYTVLGIFNSQGLVFMGLYLLGIVATLGSAWVFKQILKNRNRSFLTIQLPTYQAPQPRNVGLNVYEKVKDFVLEAGKIILIISIVLWFTASYGPTNKMAAAKEKAAQLAQEQNLNENETADLEASLTIEASYAGHFGKFIEPAIKPLGYDWKIGIALFSSLAAREVFVGTMATIYSIGSVEDELTIQERMAKERNPITGEPVYTFASALSLLLFYAFAMQCISTLAVVKRETNSWKWPIIQFTFMTGLAYLSALIVFQWLS